MEKKDYCIGLDIGTNSTGYAMTDLDGYLLKHKKRSTFGAVLFDEANTAQDRRMHRSTRRRLDRREQRIQLLQKLMEPDVLPADELFFLRLNESFLHEDDRKYPHLYGTLPKSIWADGSASNCPTIYHLRRALIETDKQADIRYIYLALHHIIKYRGHFLLEGEALDNYSSDICGTLADLLAQLTEEPFGWCFNADSHTASLILDALQKKGTTRTAKVEEILQLLEPDKQSKNAAKALASLFVGNKGSLKTLLLYEGDSPEEKIQLSGDFDEDAYLDALGNAGDVFSGILSVYRWQVFASLRKDGETISQSMIRKYEQHKKDLLALKKWVRAFAPDQYRAFFKAVSPKADNYPRYSGHYKKRQTGNQQISTLTQPDFYKAVKTLLISNKSPEAVAAAQPMMDAMNEDNGFMPLLRINLNGAIPNQLHAEELSLILERQGKYYPSLKANKSKILSLCTFRLPYYVGPLNTNSSFQKWLVRDEKTPVRPWNFDEVVDKVQTANGFIENLTNKCTYLPTEDVLPLHSLLYEEYLLLDELNRVRINGELIPPELKQKIISGLFKRRKNVTEKAFIEWLRNHTAYGNRDTIEISGLHAENGFAASLRTYIDFTERAGINVDETTIPMIESLVRWSTVFENRGILREKIQSAYPQLTDKQVNYICQRRYTGWGRLSKKLLDGILGTDKAEGKTIIDMMRLTNDNFMQVIHQKHYGFEEAIEASQPIAREGRITLEEVQALQGSPALKRGVWQAVQITEELIHHQRKLPRAIYIENTRGEDERKRGRRIPDRIRMLEEWYRDADTEIPTECTDLLAECKTDKVHLNDRQYLYFLQLGKCLYSGKRLDFNHLEQYQIDHILPQSYIKDDSIDNRALVYQSENQRKLDSMLLEDSIRHRQASFWIHLRKSKLMSEKKYHNLTRSYVDERDAVGFINRQLTETSQIIKHVTTLFKAHYPDVTVHAVNARLSSSLRDAYSLYKIRELNNTHHAFDAFLACTLGCFTDRFFWWIGDDSAAGSMVKAAWSKNSTNGLVLGMFGRDQVDKETGEILWDAQAHIQYLKQVWGYRDHFIVNKKYESTGAFFNETRYPAGSLNAKFPLRKGLPVEKYGGFDSIKPAYIAAISYRKGKKRVGTLVNVPAYLAKDAEKNPQVLVDYLKPDYTDVVILCEKILLNQKVIYDGSELLLRSCSEARNAKELYLPKDQMKLLYQLTEKAPDTWSFTQQEIDDLNTLLLTKLKEQYPIYKGISDRIAESDEKVRSLNLIEKGLFALETIKIMQASGQYAMYKNRLPVLGLSDNQGRINNKPFDLQKLVLIDQSATGFYERRRAFGLQDSCDSKPL